MYVHNIMMLTLNIKILCYLFVICFATGLGEDVDTYMITHYGFDEYPSETRQQHPPSMLCMNIRPQHSVDIKNISGLWYGNEIIMHTQDIPGEFQYHTCVVIHISDVTDQLPPEYSQYNYHNNNNYKTQMAMSTTGNINRNVPMGGIHSQQPPQQQQQYSYNSYETTAANVQTSLRYIRLVWSENDDSIEYNFNYTTNRPGLWENIGEQRGSMVVLKQYTQFKGTVQIVNAMNDHLVLTFCSSDMHHSIYTVVLSRQATGLKLDVLRSIRNLLSRRGLYTDSIRKVCDTSLMNSGQKSLTSSWLSWFTFLPAFVFIFSLGCILKKFH